MMLFGLTRDQYAFLRDWWRVFGDGTPVPPMTRDNIHAPYLFLAQRWEEQHRIPVPSMRAAA